MYLYENENDLLGAVFKSICNKMGASKSEDTVSIGELRSWELLFKEDLNATTDCQNIIHVYALPSF